MKALVIGATGATGKDLVNLLLQDNFYSDVVIFVRHSTGTVHDKLTERIIDFDKLDEIAEFIKGDILFSCLGTTAKAAGSKEAQWHIDHDIPAKFAEIAKMNGTPVVVLLSAYGASATSRIFYSKMKGQLEQQIQNLRFEKLIIFRPGLLLRKGTDRFGERVSAAVLKFLNALGLLRKFRPLPTITLAEKLAKAPRVLKSGEHFLELEEIFRF